MHQNSLYICDWLWENQPLTDEDKYLEIRNSIIIIIIIITSLRTT